MTRTRALHRVKRVDEQIHQHLLQPVGIAKHLHIVVRQILRNNNPLGAQALLDERQCVAQCTPH